MTEAPPDRDYVYVMKNMRNGLFKIGISKNPRFREKTLQSEEPEVVLLSSIPTVRYNERLLHKIFSAKRVRGEWFKLEDSEALAIEQMIISGLEQFLPDEPYSTRHPQRIYSSFRLPTETDREIRRRSKEKGISQANVVAEAVLSFGKRLEQDQGLISRLKAEIKKGKSADQ